MGGEAIQALLKTEDLGALVIELKDKLRKTKSMQARMKLAKRLKIVEGFSHFDEQTRLDGSGLRAGHPS